MTGCHCHQITIFAEIYGKNPAVFVIKNLNKYGIFGRPGSKIIFNTVVQGRTGCWNIAVSEIILGIIFALTASSFAHLKTLHLIYDQDSLCKFYHQSYKN